MRVLRAVAFGWRSASALRSDLDYGNLALATALPLTLCHPERRQPIRLLNRLAESTFRPVDKFAAAIQATGRNGSEIGGFVPSAFLGRFQQSISETHPN